LFNWYSVIPINPDTHVHISVGAVAELEDWLTGAEVAALIDGCAAFERLPVGMTRVQARRPTLRPDLDFKASGGGIFDQKNALPVFDDRGRRHVIEILVANASH
jgi:hypothetical protein